MKENDKYNNMSNCSLRRYFHIILPVVDNIFHRFHRRALDELIMFNTELLLTLLSQKLIDRFIYSLISLSSGTRMSSRPVFIYLGRR